MKVVERGINNDEELWVMSPALNKLQVCLLHAVTKSVTTSTTCSRRSTKRYHKYFDHFETVLLKQHDLPADHVPEDRKRSASECRQ